MKLLAKVLVVLVLPILVAGTAFLATWDMPSPMVPIEKTIPNERFR